MAEFVTSLAQIMALTTPDGRQLARNWGQVRTQSGSGQTDYEDGVIHRARDIYLKPGSTVYLPFDMKYDHTSPSNEDGSDSMGYVVVFIDAKGRWWRFIHIAKDGRTPFLKGLWISAGTPIGKTSLHDLGSSPSHLHLDLGTDRACVKGGVQCIDPIPALGVEGWNRLTTGRSGPNDQGPGLSGGAIVGLFLLGSALIAGVIYAGRRAALRDDPDLPPARLIK